MDMETEEIKSTDNLIKMAKDSEAEKKTDLAAEPKLAKKRGPKGPRNKGPEKSEKKTDSPRAENPLPPFPTKALCYPVLKGISAMGVQYTGDPKAAISMEEAEGMATAMELVINKYAP